MTNSTGNLNGRTECDPGAHNVLQITRPVNMTGIPDLIYPNVSWVERDHTTLQCQFNMYTDMIIRKTYNNGEVTEQIVVDPMQTAVAIGGLNLGSGLLPRNCLFWTKKKGYDRLGIYIEPKIWTVSVRGEQRAWQVPLPGLIFIGHDLDYSLWAVKEDPFGDARTPVFMAPCPNVHPQGVCRGTAPFPHADETTMYAAIDIFFGSRFNADLSQNKSKTYPENILDYWRQLDVARAPTYPLDDMVAAPFTVGGLIQL